MLKSLEKIYNCSNIIDEEWLEYLYVTKEKRYNILNVESLKEVNNHSVLNYVSRTLQILDKINKEQNLESDVLYYIEETLKWSEVSKTGNKTIRNLWKQKHFDLFCHNIGSYQIYSLKHDNKIVQTLIKTHGLIGQYIKGEVNLNKNIEIYNLVKDNLISKDKLRKILVVLNRCIIEAVSVKLYNNLENEINDIINKILTGNLNEEINIIDRFKKLNKKISSEEIKFLSNLDNKIVERLEYIFSKVELWYYDGALSDFCLEEQVKILLILFIYIKYDTFHLTFESMMNMLYLDYKEKRQINIYKKRIIESYLKELSFQDIINNNIKSNSHITYEVKQIFKTLEFNFKFSLVSRKLIEFCEVAANSDAIYQQAIYMLYDLLGFRRDAYDRFYNELEYLKRMNNSMNEKSVILDYIIGDTILDVGPGGGGLLDLIEKFDSKLNVMGIDLSQNVIDKLSQKKIEENHKWDIIKGDALNLNDYFESESINTIIYSSIIHELYSYIEYEGKKFNKETIKQSLCKAYEVLSKGGRIIIRDGIMTEPQNQYRLIEFKDIRDIKILKRYCNDFKGRQITFEQIDSNTVKMLVNDAMEFLYTYTWGEQSYPLEVNEQFGYFTLSEYVNFIKENLHNVKIIESKSFLQSGYEEHLLPKITIYDESRRVVSLPDSTCIIVIEKG